MNRRLTCVVVDDSDDWLELIKHALSQSPDSVETVAFLSPLNALDYLRRHPVDIVISDLHMPVIDGFAFIEEFRSFEKNTPVILVSTDEFAGRSATARGASAFVRKRAARTALLRAITRVLPVGTGAAERGETSGLPARDR